MKNTLLTLIILLFAQIAFSQATRNDLKISIKGLNADNKISRADLDRVDTLLIEGPGSEDYKIKSAVYTILFTDVLKEFKVNSIDVFSTFKHIVSLKDQKKFFIENIIIQNIKTKKEYKIPDVKMFVTNP